MIDTTDSPGRTAEDLPERERPGLQEGDDDQAVPGDSKMSASAQRLHITSLQHWLALCA